MSKDNVPHKRILKAFDSMSGEDLSRDEVGRMLVSVSYCLGQLIADLNRRGVSWEVIDRNVRQAMLRGVDVVTEEPLKGPADVSG